MPHHITHEHVQEWLNAYEHAWQTYDADEVAALFTEDAEYRWHPYDEPEQGRDAIVHAWLNPGDNTSDRDAPGTYQGEYKPYAVDGSRAVAIGTSTYWTDATRSKVARLYYNNWLLEFGDDGRCCSFTEYYVSPRGS
ncbi:MAG TPA: nuclear transport factor 2 family protein [Gaiellaceae bacterium]|nr:nuclear transport factor 2 family protein [Gaiellaceae bacterium]